MTKYIYSWNNGEGAKALAAAMGIQRIKHENSRFQGNPRKTVINYGSSTLPASTNTCRIINRPELVGAAANKLTCFRRFAEAGENAPRVPEWTTDRNVALAWVSEGSVVCARQSLTGNSARGLVLMDRNLPDSLVDAPLYVKYVKKKDEYRVHVVNGAVILTQRKGLSEEYKNGLGEGEKPDTRIRNLANGYIFVRNDGRPVPEDVTAQALRAMAASGLDFGAVDVIFNSRDNQAYVLEINTAPGLVGTTVQDYATALGAM